MAGATAVPAGLSGGDAPVTTLRGVGPALAEALGRLGLAHVSDLWFHLPLRYEDRTRITPIADLVPGARVQTEGRVDAVERGFRFRPQLKVALSDDSGAVLVLRFIHFTRAQAERFVPGVRIRVFGDVRDGHAGLEMVHPAWQIVSADTPLEATLTPLYPSTEGLAQRRLAGLIQQSLTLLPDDASLECLPASIRRRLGLSSLRAALRFVHRPPPDADVAALLAATHPAQRRLAVDELMGHQISMRMRRTQLRTRQARAIGGPGARRSLLLSALPFALTRAQQRVVAEIERDLAQPLPMLRLLQGDVGAGKTVVAALVALSVIDAGAQVALMAPTEVLAEQHWRNFSHWLAPLGVRIVRLSGTVKGRARKQALEAIAGAADLVVGTHALMQNDVAFRELALAIIDEQHRFGVHQRLRLRDKGGDGALTAHQLVMTATPIPRTLAMAGYADLDVSVIDELPPGRSPIVTVAVSATRRDEVIARIRAAVAEGRQAYWVCTLIDESDKLAAQAAQTTWQSLVEALPGVRVGLVHGRLGAADKQAVMAAFQGGEIALLVATTVIEVGVDVPNASLMVIENAERLGLAQLHQLRGRVGRGSTASTCVLLYQPPLSAAARERLTILRETGDGFRIAEKDLELRGPGELLGTRQAGEAGFRVAVLGRDAALLPDIAAAAEELLRVDRAAAERLVQRWVGQALRYAEA